MTEHRFAITGVAGFVAPRHLKAISDVGGTVVAALDPHDAVGILDRYDRKAEFFTEPERFERYILRARREGKGINWLSVCSPNHLHDAHVWMGLRAGADVICEKPMVLSPWNLDAIQSLESDTGRRAFTVLQLRHSGNLIALRDRFIQSPPRGTVFLRYTTPRGRWYQRSWKGDELRSGGLVVNIGIHLLDLVLWMFGPLINVVGPVVRTKTFASGHLALTRAEVSWCLSIDGDNPERILVIDGENFPFGDDLTDLHTKVYFETIAGRGAGVSDARPSVELAYRLRMAP